MKLASLFLSIYFLLLSVTPCSDAVECTDGSQTSISILSGHENHTHEAEMCSPFCVCACCGQDAPTPLDDAAMSCESFHSAQAISLYESTFPMEVHLAIWQPPKIG